MRKIEPNSPYIKSKWKAVKRDNSNLYKPEEIVCRGTWNQCLQTKNRLEKRYKNSPTISIEVIPDKLK